MLDEYTAPGQFDEMFDAEGRPRPGSTAFVERLRTLTLPQLRQRQQAAELMLRNMGITFNVYGDVGGTEKVWPFDLLPRIIDGAEWETVDRGLRQRMTALNLFLDDIYNERRILRDHVLPEELIMSSKTLRSQCVGFHPPLGVWCHITGVDLIRGADGRLFVLEDNLRCPSGVSYVLENRELMKRTFSRMFHGMSIAPIEDYGEQLLEMLIECAPPGVDNPTVVVLTPGIFNSAYFEHTFLAQQMGVELVQGSDLVVENGRVHMNTTRGLQRVDVIYRRIDDDFIDPTCFRPDSCLGVSHLMDVYRAGRVTLANAPGTGVADDKAVYAYVPEIIRYYLGEDPILPNVPTYLCSDPKQREHVLQNLDKLVVKPTNESGGYGILMGPMSSAEERSACADAIRGNPRNWIAQPMVQLSTVPTLTADGGVCPRHVDLRPFVLCGKDIYVMPGGLTRVALKEGSMIVNSSQGGGSKDTWVLRSNAGRCDTSQQEQQQC
ncbi:MAG: circularly permuted type 2 ATP-grasp protein [Planctomycetales bacterium]|nr:circularly permuted type 2 ATP-grasp protein [Planctomycetales bacterium]